MKPGHLDTAIKTGLGHINTMLYWFINLKMNVDYKTSLIFVQPILDSMVLYLKVVEIKQVPTVNGLKMPSTDRVIDVYTRESKVIP